MGVDPFRNVQDILARKPPSYFPFVEGCLEERILVQRQATYTHLILGQTWKQRLRRKESKAILHSRCKEQQQPPPKARRRLQALVGLCH